MNPPGLTTAIAQLVQSRGGRALLVGGCVRDELLGLTPKDFDLEVFGVAADDLRALLGTFGRVDAVGESFGVFKIGGLDVALPRRESKSGRGHKGFHVTGDPALSTTDAARRRDAVDADEVLGLPARGQRAVRYLDLPEAAILEGDELAVTIDGLNVEPQRGPNVAAAPIGKAGRGSGALCHGGRRTTDRNDEREDRARED